MGLFGVTGSNKWRATPGSHLEESHPGDRLLACVMSFLIGNVWCKYQVWCPWEMSAPLSGSRFLLHFLNSLVRLGVFQITWKWFGRHVGNGNAARRGRSWILLRKEVWYLHCWFCSATEPVSVPGVPKNQGVLNIQFLWMDLASSLLVFCGRKGPCDQQDRHQLTSCKGREAVFNYIWSW